MEGLLQSMAGGPAPDPLAQEIHKNVNPNGPKDFDNPMGIGTEPATEEENQKLEVVMDGIEAQIHGPNRDKIVSMLTSTPELWNNIANAAVTILEGAHQKLAQQKVELEPDYYFGENGIIQSTVELLFELAVAAGAPKANDSNQLDAAYMKTMTMIGEDLYETDDVASAEAQQAMIDLELGEGASELAAEGFNLLNIPEGGMDIPAYEMEGAADLMEDPLSGAEPGGML